MVANCFFLAYQQPFVILAGSLRGGVIWSSKQLSRAGLIYFVACLIALAITIPYWNAVGLIG